MLYNCFKRNLPFSAKSVITDTALPIQVADLKARNQQLDSENTELSQRNSKNLAAGKGAQAKGKGGRKMYPGGVGKGEIGTERATRKQ